MISELEVSEALTFLSSTDESAAKAKSYFMGLGEQCKTIHAIEFLKHEGPIEERKSQAYASWDYRQHLVKLEQANLDYETLRNKRLTAELKIEVWRSENANRRRGNI